MATPHRIDPVRRLLSALPARLRRRVRPIGALPRDQRGNVLLLACFSLIPLTTAIGMVVDYSSAARLQTKLTAVADAAALAAITTPMMKQPMLAACGAARRMFVNGSGGLRGLTIAPDTASGLTISIAETYLGQAGVTATCPTVDLSGVPIGLVPTGRTVTVTYRGQSANSFSGLLGKSTLAIGGTSTATASLAPFIDIHLALDTSQSMGLAATDAGAADLFRETLRRNKRGCQFGCHERDPREPFSMERIARDAGIKLRVDVEREAALDMIDTARSLQGAAQNYQFALYRIGVKTSTIQRLTTDLAVARAAVSTLELGENDGSVGFGDTNLPDLTSSVLASIPARGDGSSRLAARSFLFIVSDGVTDLCGWYHCTAPIDPATCQVYKDQKITVGVVYTTYLPVKQNPADPNDKRLEGNYINLVQRHAPNIGPALKACASDGWFFEASDETGIHAAITRLFDQATKSPTITR